MKIDFKALVAKSLPFIKGLKRYASFILVISFLLIYSFLVLQVNLLDRREPTEDAVTEKLKSVQRPKIDKLVLSKIQDLQDQNVEVQSLFKQARDNPFSE
ncbi:hypothetical protein HY218_01380 [Candidatus Saccharibacteria bacterium]|nr:hypothetical protein [Candidatus Saccharibacteria bacterium]